MTDDDQNPRRLLVHLPPRRHAPVLAIAFPSVGNGCGQLVPFARAAAGTLDVWGVNLPGRHARLDELPHTRFEPLAVTLAAALAEIRDDRPVALLGYRSGALLAFGLARALRDHAGGSPDLLVAIGYPAPRDDFHLDVTDVPSEIFWHFLLTRGGVPAEVAEPQNRELFEPGLRGDYSVLADFRRSSDDWLPLTRVLALVGDDEPDALKEAMGGWAEHAGGGFRIATAPGGEWLLDEVPDEVARMIVEDSRSLSL